MKHALILMGLALGMTASTQAKEHDDYQKGTLMEMNSSSCGYAEKDGKTVVGEIIGTDGQHKNTKEVLCQEYLLQGDKLIYRIRPKDDKHPTLLPIGETAMYRLHKDKLILRVPEADGKEREYIVVSMTPRTDLKIAQAPHVEVKSVQAAQTNP